MRQVVLDTETTGLSPQQGHRLTEIGCIELIDRRVTGKTFQSYLNPEREIDERAAQITGLTWEKLKHEPKFAQVVEQFIEFVGTAELVIHNASFDLGFIEHELSLLQHDWLHVLHDRISVIDTLAVARQMHPGQRNSLDALCKRYSIDNTHRNLHGALLDAQILAQVYLAMSSGQTVMDLGARVDSLSQQEIQVTGKKIIEDLTIVYADAAEQEAHAAMLRLLKTKK